MRIAARAITVVILLLLGSLLPDPGGAAVILVGVFGSDTSTCGPVSPCRTLQYAVNRAASGDTIYLGNPVNFGPATIAKAVEIVGVGTGGAGIYSPTVPCITVTAPAGTVVVISGITCDQGGAARDGIVFNSGKRLQLSDVTLRRGGAGACGIRFRPSTNAFLSLTGVFATEWGSGGACFQPRSTAKVGGSLDGASLQDNTYGILAVSAAGTAIKLTCDDCNVSGGGTGVYASGAASLVRLRDSRVTGNNVGLNRLNGGRIVSGGGNSITGNTTNGTFTP